MKYGDEPIVVGTLAVECQEMMFYQYLPIKLKDNPVCDVEARLNVFKKLISMACVDFYREFGPDAFNESYVYLTAKNQYQKGDIKFNRPGYHSDGFLTDDINYIWSDKSPTIFNNSEFNLTLDDVISLQEMESQALKENEFSFPNNTMLKLNQFNIHKVADNQEEGIRTFVKISFSKDKYDLVGNSHNYLLDYKWKMKSRNQNRNIPQSKIK